MSRLARESSNYSDFAKFEREFSSKLYANKITQASNYRTVVIEQNITFYRTYDAGAKVSGSFVTTTPAGNRINAKINTALVPE